MPNLPLWTPMQNFHRQNVTVSTFLKAPTTYAAFLTEMGRPVGRDGNEQTALSIIYTIISSEDRTSVRTLPGFPPNSCGTAYSCAPNSMLLIRLLVVCHSHQSTQGTPMSGTRQPLSASGKFLGSLMQTRVDHFATAGQGSNPKTWRDTRKGPGFIKAISRGPFGQF